MCIMFTLKMLQVIGFVREIQMQKSRPRKVRPPLGVHEEISRVLENTL
jgi:hypothetical protein